ncbi:alpha/beta-hydrolase [Panus rudis PR-1116 ss-1]|nr:alpha/beta-hydrolase [Panus rudis PR-1116 ss-1]
MPRPGEGQYLTSKDGTKIWADASGDPSKPHVVFIHGLACTALAFEKQFSDPNLLNNLYMVRYELRGHGRSDQPSNAEAYESIRYAEDYRTVCEAYNLKKPFICGWSYGALIPVDVIDAYGADDIAGIIYAGGPMLTRYLHSQYIHPTIASLIPALLDPSPDALPTGARLFVESCVENPEETLPFDTKIKWIGGTLMQTPTARTHTVMRGQNTKRWEEEIKNIPALLIQGEADRHSQTEKLIPVAHQWVPKLDVVVLKGVGHAPAFENAVDTNRALLEFVQRVTSGN